ncbi:hypothetical protein BTH_II1585 [Burkholderia thailandensis E264]|uniref:Uncharacterized protein n=1 Tax=Burkholderia thailandensis (strain ATCC 700388 / DSM 13276 / CCUG 48851 / CIP 106301 / E264) TaxID=271848 RepID=Q2T4W9_BURTA|nr:hypothetical protein BTH_II1585 [Burkholderia thailandensis E264]
MLAPRAARVIEPARRFAPTRAATANALHPGDAD